MAKILQTSDGRILINGSDKILSAVIFIPPEQEDDKLTIQQVYSANQNENTLELL